jgi:hypothetical protein
MLLRVLLIRTMSTMLWRTYVLVSTRLLPGIYRLSLMPRLLVQLLVRLGLLLDLESSLVVVPGLLRRLVLLHSLVSLLVPAMLLLPHLVVPIPGRRVFSLRD